MSSGDGCSRNRAWVSLAVGAGTLVGLAGLYFAYEAKNKHVKSRLSSSSRNSMTRSNSTETLSTRSYLSFSNESIHETQKDKFSDLDTESGEETYFDALDDTEVHESQGHTCIKNDKELFEEVEALLEGDEEEQINAFNLLLENQFKFHSCPDFLWRLAQAHKFLATTNGNLINLGSKEKLINDGVRYARKAIDLDKMNGDAHKWYGILKGMQNEFVPINQKIVIAMEFKKHIDIALKYKYNDYLLHHLLGRFKYEVAQTSWLEKQLASVIFPEFQTFTYKDAIPHLLEAEKLNSSSWKENKLFLAKCYIGENKYTDALHWLDSAKRVLLRMKDDFVCDEEIDVLLKKYQKYRC